MQQALKTSFLKSLFAARREAKPAALQTLDRAALRKVAGGDQAPVDTPKGGW